MKLTSLVNLGGRPFYQRGHTKFTTSGAHHVIAITSPQTFAPKSYEIEPSHWTGSVYVLEKLDSVVYLL